MPPGQLSREKTTPKCWSNKKRLVSNKNGNIGQTKESPEGHNSRRVSLCTRDVGKFATLPYDGPLFS